MEIIAIILGVANLLLIIVLIALSLLKKPANQDLTKFADNIDQTTKKLDERMIKIEAEVDKFIPKVSDEFRANRKEISVNLEGIQRTVDTRVKDLQTENTKKLEEMRETVDEKLKASVEKRFNESFKTLSQQLTQVYEGIGEVKGLTTDVGDLKKVMEGVKTRGIYGEVQLGSIISDMLNSNQYEENIITKRSSNDRVEFAIKMPGQNNDTVYLPIDSKFPVENYSRLVTAYDSGDKNEITKYQKALATDVKEQAKKIATKYLDPPATTPVAVMFVPTESLYAEILRISGLSDEIRSKFNVNIVSPSTLPAIISGLQAGFRTVAISERSNEVLQTLGAVKAQFGKFGDLLEATHKKLTESAHKIESAATTSRQIERKLKNVEALPANQSAKLLGDINVE